MKIIFTITCKKSETNGKRFMTSSSGETFFSGPLVSSGLRIFTRESCSERNEGK